MNYDETMDDSGITLAPMRDANANDVFGASPTSESVGGVSNSVVLANTSAMLTPGNNNNNNVNANGNNNWNTKKFRDEYEMTKSRLSDQKFSMGQFRDPLFSRRPKVVKYPPGVTPEMEQQLKEFVAKVKAGGVS